MDSSIEAAARQLLALLLAEPAAAAEAQVYGYLVDHLSDLVSDLDLPGPEA